MHFTTFIILKQFLPRLGQVVKPGHFSIYNLLSGLTPRLGPGYD
jgi:hypothetical protein